MGHAPVGQLETVALAPPRRVAQKQKLGQPLVGAADLDQVVIIQVVRLVQRQPMPPAVVPEFVLAGQKPVGQRIQLRPHREQRRVLRAAFLQFVFPVEQGAHRLGHQALVVPCRPGKAQARKDRVAPDAGLVVTLRQKGALAGPAPHEFVLEAEDQEFPLGGLAQRRRFPGHLVAEEPLDETRYERGHVNQKVRQRHRAQHLAVAIGGVAGMQVGVVVVEFFFPQIVEAPQGMGREQVRVDEAGDARHEFRVQRSRSVIGVMRRGRHRHLGRLDRGRAGVSHES
jgi:hypothetical protein